MSIIDEIKQAQVASIPQEYKEKMLDGIKAQLVSGCWGDYAYIVGAKHYPDPKWEMPSYPTGQIEAPFSYHEAIATWLRSLGFTCCRHYNRGGVDQGMEIRIAR